MKKKKKRDSLYITLNHFPSHLSIIPVALGPTPPAPCSRAGGGGGPAAAPAALVAVGLAHHRGGPHAAAAAVQVRAPPRAAPSPTATASAPLQGAVASTEKETFNI